MFQLSLTSARSYFILLVLVLYSTLMVGQNKDVCEDNDCPPSLFSVELNEPSSPKTPANFSNERTANFRHAFLQFQKIKNSYANNPDWQAKHDASQIGGQSCLRHYQLESKFAHEYSQNPDFKKFVDSETGGGNEFMEKGFESSRRGLNLERRMKSNCSGELKDMDKKPGPKREELPKEYDKLGKDLGYFDEQGNLLKPMKELTKEEPEQAGNSGKKLSKKQQVEQLKQQVAALPVGQQMRDKIGGVKNDLTNAKPKLGLLKNALGLLGSKVGTFLPGPFGLASKLDTVNDLLKTLKSFVPKISVPGLLSKIGNLFNKGKRLGEKAKDLVNKGNKLKDKINDLGNQANKLQNKIDDKLSTINGLQNKLDELARKKEELTQKLNDKPKKILDELKSEVADVSDKAKDMANKVEDEIEDKDKLLDQLKDLEKEKEKAEEELKKLEDEFKVLSKQGEELEKEANEVAKEVEEIKKQEQKIDDIKQQVEDLKPEADLQEEISDCENELKKILADLTGVEDMQEKLKKKMGGLLAWPGKILKKVTDLKLFQDKLKLPANGIPITGKALAKLDDLSDKATAIGSLAEILTGKKTKLQETIEGYDKKLDKIKSKYDIKTADLDKLKSELFNLIREKTDIKDKLNGTVEDMNGLEKQALDFINRYNIFDEKSDCLGNKELEQEVEDLKNKQSETEPKIDDLEKELEEADQQEQQLEQDTKEVEEEIKEDMEKAEELKKEEEALKEEFGNDVKLEPVTKEEWSESFEVERPYWDAIFHPDDEVVDGYKGRYFEVRLKDAEKNVKLLFEPGKYYMSKKDFRRNYGSTIGSFVTEALHAMKKSDQEKIILFIQGSADIAGDKTFSGNLDESFFYEDITVLPQKGSENFSNESVKKEIPDRNFRNKHLPDLRAAFLKEMISFYSKKFDPVLLEGSVQNFQDEEERNAIIYLFIPEELL